MNSIKIARSVTAFTAVLIFLLTFILGIQPRIQELGRISSDLVQAEALLLSQQAKLARLIDLSEDIVLLEREKELLEVALPPTLRISEFVRELNTNASSAGVNITGLDIGAPNPFEAPARVSDNPKFESDLSNLSGVSFYVVDVDVTLTGSITSIKEFIRVFQDNPRTVVLHRFFFSSGAAATVDGKLSLRAQVFILSN